MQYHVTVTNSYIPITQVHFHSVVISTAAYGRGVFFARDASYSASDKYSPRDNSNHKFMFLVKVLTGELARYDDIQPPSASSGKTHFSCGVDDINNPLMFVIYSDTQAYPEYLITFV